jgi:hypothetical protein
MGNTTSEPIGEWSGNDSHLCYETDPAAATSGFCGQKDLCSGKGLLLPLFLEVTWAREARAILYFIALMYSFLGVSIVADVFMCAIERITSSTKTINIASSGSAQGKFADIGKIIFK